MPRGYPTPPFDQFSNSRRRRHRILGTMDALAQTGSQLRRAYVEHFGPSGTQRMIQSVANSANPLPQKNMKGAIENKLAGRAAVKQFGKKKKLASRKSVKVSKGLREKVKKVIAGENAYGEYHVRKGGEIGYLDPALNTAVTATYALAKDTIYSLWVLHGRNIPFGQKCWWASHVKSEAANGAIIENDQDAFVYFTPLKILNAASVLWNQKVASPEWATVTGNFSNMTTFSSGGPNVGTESIPYTGALDIRIVNSYAKWNLKNCNQRTVKLKIYHCVAKVKFPDSGPLTALYAGINDIDSSTVRRLMTGGPVSATAGNTTSALICHPQFEPKTMPGFNSQWGYSMSEIILKPGEEYVHTIQGPKNYTLDFKKLAMGDSEVGSFYKGTSVCLMVSVELDAVMYNPSGTATTQRTGQAFNQTATIGDIVPKVINQVSIEVDEVYKLSCPISTGFLTTAGVAGSVQQLNFKADRYSYQNFNPTSNKDDSYNGYNEENPATAIPEAITN